MEYLPEYFYSVNQVQFYNIYVTKSLYKINDDLTMPQ